MRYTELAAMLNVNELHKIVLSIGVVLAQAGSEHKQQGAKDT